MVCFRFTVWVSGFSLGGGEFGDKVHLLGWFDLNIPGLRLEYGPFGEVTLVADISLVVLQTTERDPQRMHLILRGDQHRPAVVVSRVIVPVRNLGGVGELGLLTPCYADEEDRSQSPIVSGDH